MNSEFPVRMLLIRNLVILLANLRQVFRQFETVHENYFVTPHDYRKGGSDKGVTAIKLLRKFGLHKAHQMVLELADHADIVEQLLVHGTDLSEEAIDKAWSSKVGLLNEMSMSHDIMYILKGKLPKDLLEMLSSETRQRLQDALLYGGTDEDTDICPE